MQWHRQIKSITVFILLIVLGACTSQPSTQATTEENRLSNFNCDQIITLTDETIQCLSVEQNGLLLQSTNTTQVNLSITPANITFEDTLYLEYQAPTLIIAPLSGISVVGLNGTTRIIQPGSQISLQTEIIADGTISIINSSSISPISVSISNTTLLLLNRTVRLPQPISTPRPTAIIIIEANTECVVPDDWGGFYTIERGDTLSAIAQQFGITLSELQNANCLTNINVINPGDVLRVPTTETATVTFQAQTENIQNGECTQVEWSVDIASVVYFDGNPVARTGSQQVCPTLDSTYTLLVISDDGNQVGYTTTINVSDN